MQPAYYKSSMAYVGEPGEDLGFHKTTDYYLYHCQHFKKDLYHEVSFVSSVSIFVSRFEVLTAVGTKMAIALMMEAAKTSETLVNIY
jgi:hypothetical protein